MSLFLSSPSPTPQPPSEAGRHYNKSRTAFWENSQDDEDDYSQSDSREELDDDDDDDSYGEPRKMPKPKAPKSTRKAVPLPRRSKKAAVEDVEADVEPAIRVAVPPPEGAVELDLPGRDPRLPKLYRIPTHPLVKNPDANIILGMWDWAKKSQAELLKHSSTFRPPSDAAERTNFGKLSIFYSTSFDGLT